MPDPKSVGVFENDFEELEGPYGYPGEEDEPDDWLNQLITEIEPTEVPWRQ